MFYETLSLSHPVNMTYSRTRFGTILGRESRSPLDQNGFNLKAGTLRLRISLFKSIKCISSPTAAGLDDPLQLPGRHTVIGLPKVPGA